MSNLTWLHAALNAADHDNLSAEERIECEKRAALFTEPNSEVIISEADVHAIVNRRAYVALYA